MKIYSDIEWEEKLNELFDYLINGKLPDDVQCPSPKISREQAGNILWFLQEVTGIIPDNYEVCAICGDVHSDIRYFDINGKHYCYGCQEYAPVGICEECNCVEIYKHKSYSKKDGLYLCKDCRSAKRAKTK